MFVFISFQLKPSAGNFTAAGRAAGLKLVDHSQNPSSSCPQLTVEEPTSTTSSIDDENGKASDQVSISPTFYEQLFCTKLFCSAFLYVQVGFVIFWPKNNGAKAAYKMLVKMISSVTYTIAELF